MEICINFLKLLPKFDEIKTFEFEHNEIISIFKLTTITIEKILDIYLMEKSEDEKMKLIIELIEEPSFLIESVIERTWEMINIGHFSEVPITVRKMYALANYFKIVFQLLHNHLDTNILEKCFESMDKALLIGYTDNLYKNNEFFLMEIEKFLNKYLKPTISNLPYIEPIAFEKSRCDIPVLDCPSITDFNENYFNQKRPVLLRNIISHWPAHEKWRDINYLLNVAGNRTVPIEIGTNYSSDEWSQELMKIKDFLCKNFGSEEISVDNIEYLAQHELFDEIPKLKEDIRYPDYCIFNTKYGKRDVDIKAWLGPAGTISPLHQDTKNNILCQVFGRKKIILASPDDTEFLYPHETQILKNTSRIDAENVNISEFPLTKNVKFYELILQESECIYLPPKWWHYVKSLNKSFSVSFWW